ncbi:MAG: DUF4326 domain-containing protein [Candidatus Sulfotelmatobacter sp.]|jgi:hypothetical protein
MTTERLTISFDPEKGKLRITDGRMMESLGHRVPRMIMWGPPDKRKELVARYNKWREGWGLPPLPDPDLPKKEPEPEIRYGSFDIDPLTGRPLASLQRPKSPKRKPRKSPVAEKPSPAPLSSASRAEGAGTARTTVVHVQKTKAPFAYIGRSFAEFGDSIWHNPFKIELGCGRKCVLEKYEAYVRSRPDLMAQLHTLKGKALGCWCKDKHGRGKACHGDVLVKLIEETLVDE